MAFSSSLASGAGVNEFLAIKSCDEVCGGVEYRILEVKDHGGTKVDF